MSSRTHATLNVYDSCMPISIACSSLVRHGMQLPHVIRKKWETELLINGGEVALIHVEVEKSTTGVTLCDAQKTANFTRPRKPIPTEQLFTMSML
uniref:Uncharacterized protein n=1 Tax=Trichuris muris TaxID=70415 RepID=A0A5S6PZM0_TRIMR